MKRYPYLEFELEIGACSLADEAFVDTGYDGGLIIPERETPGIDSPSFGHRMRMADGFRHVSEAWDGVLLLAGKQLDVVAVAFGDEYILGRDVLNQFEVCFEYGERVTLKHERMAGGAGL